MYALEGFVVKGDGSLTLVQGIPEPVTDDYEVLTKTIACGICNGTDVKLVEGKLRGFTDYPAVLGHEAVGEVIRVGKKVRNFKVGDHVLRTNLKDTDAYFSLWGGFAKYGCANDYMARVEDGLPADIGTCTQQIIPREIDPIDGVMIITLKEICSALHRLGLKKGMRIVIAGCGPVGISMAALAKQMGAGKILLSGHHEERLKTAGRMGADWTVNSKKEVLTEAVKTAMPEGVDLFVDCVGRTSIIDEGMQVIKESGKIGLYGIGMHTGDTIDWDKSPYNFQLHSVQWPIAEEEKAVHEEVIRYVIDGKINLRELVTHRLPAEKYETGFELVKNRKGLKIAIEF